MVYTCPVCMEYCVLIIHCDDPEMTQWEIPENSGRVECVSFFLH